MGPLAYTCDWGSQEFLGDLRLARAFVFCLRQTFNGQHMAVDNANCPFHPGLTSQSINKPSQTLGASFHPPMEEMVRLGFLLQGH